MSQTNFPANKYNFALIPQSKSKKIIELAIQFSHLADNYLLGETSLPHVTLYQFHAVESHIPCIWERMCLEWMYEPIQLTFEKFSCISFDDHIYWASLLPNKLDILHKMHECVASVVSLPVNRLFDPHMTLFNTKNKAYENEIVRMSTVYESLSEKFILSLGVSDDIGQLQKIIFAL